MTNRPNRRPASFADVLLHIIFGAVVIVAVLAAWRYVRLETAYATVAAPWYTAWRGAAENPSLTVVEFFDYRCYPCRVADSTVTSVLAEPRNADVRLVYRMLPVYGADSLADIRFALAAAKQGKFAPVHAALIDRENPVTDADIDTIANAAGIDLPALHAELRSPEMGDHLLQTIDIAGTLPVDSTPAFLFGRVLYAPQDVPTDPAILQSMIDEMRREAAAP